MPLHAGPASRALPPFLTDEGIPAYLDVASPLKRVTPATIPEPDLLWAEVCRVRRQGYAQGCGNHYMKATYIAFPMLDSSGWPHAPISVAAPAERFTPAHLALLLPGIFAIAENLNALARLYLVPTLVHLGAS